MAVRGEAVRRPSRARRMKIVRGEAVRRLSRARRMKIVRGEAVRRLSRARRMKIMRRAVVLLSGGVDSSTALAVARRDGFEVHALSFDYGQRHRVELTAARRVASALGAARHEVVTFDLTTFGGSALTADIPVPKDRAPAEIARGVPITYVPARNTIFLAFALARAETLNAHDIFTGFNVYDYSGYPDCRPEYVAAFQAMADLATKAGVEGRQRLQIHTPLIALSKRDIIRTGLTLGLDYALTSSCYDPAPGGEACGRCDACLLRLKGFAEAGVPDPIRYRAAERVSP